MSPAFKWLAVLFAISLSSASVNAACGGGGYKPSKPSKPASHEVSYTESQSSNYKQQREAAEKFDKLQQDVERAQAKLNNCSGDCEKERRKLNEAVAKLDAHANRYGIVRHPSAQPPPPAQSPQAAATSAR